jgi:hypothetical protein
MDSITFFFVDLLKIVVSGLIIFFIIWEVVKPQLLQLTQSKILDLKKASLATTLPLRLQAYERLALFIERINPESMLVRVHVSGTTVRELQQFLVEEIRTEYQHNITQQLYVSAKAWSVIGRIKDDSISMVNNAAKGLLADASSLELSKVILTHLGGLEDNPYHAGLMLIRHDMEQFF